MTIEGSISSSSRRADRVLLEIAREVEREISRIVAEMDTQKGVLQSTKDNLANLAQIKERVRASAGVDGSKKLAAILDKEIPKVVKEILAKHKGLGQFAPQISEDVERVLSGQVDEIAQQMRGEVASELARAVRVQISTGARASDALRAIAKQIDASMGRVSVLVERSIREVHDETVRRGGELAAEATGEDVVYVYVGPEDDVTRPYCDQRVGRYLTQQQADELDPEERFRCRHSLAPILLSEAQRRGIEGFTG